MAGSVPDAPSTSYGRTRNTTHRGPHCYLEVLATLIPLFMPVCSSDLRGKSGGVSLSEDSLPAHIDSAMLAPIGETAICKSDANTKFTITPRVCLIAFI